MSPNIKKSHVLVNDIFKAEKIHNSKLKYLNLKIEKKKNKSIFQGSINIPRTNLESWGVYFMFFKTSLIYERCFKKHKIYTPTFKVCPRNIDRSLKY